MRSGMSFVGEKDPKMQVQLSSHGSTWIVGFEDRLSPVMSFQIG